MSLITIDCRMKQTLWTLADAAKILKVSTRHLSRVIARGEIPVVRLSPRVVRIERSALIAYIEGKREGGRG
jgi:excisionase family DNA binding protein